jgi:hypothetical protein
MTFITIEIITNKTNIEHTFVPFYADNKVITMPEFLLKNYK